MLKNNYKFIIWLILSFVIVLVGYSLRKDDYATVPLPGTSMDEYSYSWVGLSLIETGYPVGISGIDGYKNQLYKYINVDDVYQSTAGGNPLKINYPWFDHPPTLGLITGGYAWMKGARTFEETNAYLIRKPMLWLGSLTLASLMVLLLINSGYVASVVGGIMWATIPSVVISSRMIQAENGVIPFWLLSLIFISLYRKNRKLGYLIFAGLLAGVVTLFKLSGIVCLLSSIVILLSDSRRYLKRDLMVFFFYYSLIASLFVVYGLIIDPYQFIAIFLSNSSRYYGIGSEAVLKLLTQTKLTNLKYITEPWLLVSWLAFFVALSRKKLSVYAISLCSYLAIYIFFGSYPYGWYSFPFWPFLIAELAVLLSSSIRSVVSPLWAFWSLLLVGGYYLTKFVNIEEFQRFSSWWKNSIFIISVLLMIVSVMKKKAGWMKYLSALLLVLMFTVAVYLSYKFLRTIDIDYWYKLS